MSKVDTAVQIIIQHQGNGYIKRIPQGKDEAGPPASGSQEEEDQEPEREKKGRIKEDHGPCGVLLVVVGKAGKQEKNPGNGHRDEDLQVVP